VKALLTEPLPIESNSVDCILSNCVVNLLPPEGKASLLKEVTRILKPGGRVVLDDIVAKKSIPEDMKNDIASYVGCISGAITLEEYQTLLKDAGLPNATFVETKRDLNVYFEYGKDDASISCCSAPSGGGATAWKPSYDVNEWVGAYQIYALKDGVPVEKPPTVLSNWWAAYPAVKSSPASMKAEEVVALKKDPASSAEFAVIDVRRNDHAGGHVRGSDNWAAQTFYDNLPAFYEKYKDTPKVIFYCQNSKPNARGPRSAGWYQDYLNSQEGHKSTAYILEGGIKSWLAKYGDDEDLFDRD
jgi:rhodanese-related sulfurtransferase